MSVLLRACTAGTQLDGLELGSEALDRDVVLKPGVPFQLAGDSKFMFMVQPAGVLEGAV